MIRVGPVFRVFVEPAVPNWECWRWAPNEGLLANTAFAGIHAYPQLVYAIEVKPHVLETDPGPLDAKVS